MQILQYLPLVLALMLSESRAYSGPSVCDMHKRLKFAYFSPSSPGNTYWPKVFQVMTQVANDLRFDFVHYDLGTDNRLAIREAVGKALRTGNKPDAIVITLPAGNTRSILEMAEKANVPVIIHGPLFPHELPAIGMNPRNTYKKWISYFTRSDSEAGYRLAKDLLQKADRAKAYNSQGKIEVVGMSGMKSWYGVSLREEGLLRAIQEHPRASLNQILPTNLTAKEGLQKSLKVLKRFPSTSVIWAATDQLALAAASALESTGKILGKTAFTGGIDLSEMGLRGIMEGKLEATVAPPSYAMSQVMVYLFDYMHGIDFIDDVGAMPLMELITATKENASQILGNAAIASQVDFQRLSKCYNKNLKKYDFSLKALRSSIEE